MKSTLRILLAVYFYVGFISLPSASISSFLDQKEEESFNVALTTFQNLTNKPTCFFSYAGGLGGKTVDTLAPHLETAGINILQDVEQADFIVVCASKELINTYNNNNPEIIISTKIQLDKIKERSQNLNHNILPIWLEGDDKKEVLPKFLWDESAIDFRNKEEYCLNCFELLRKLYKLDSNDSFLIQTINGHKARLLNPSVINKPSNQPDNKPTRWINPKIAAVGVAVLAAFGVSRFWGNDSSINNTILSLDTPCNPSLLRNDICYACDNGAYPLIRYNLIYLPDDGCPPELAPELVYSLGEESEKDYQDYLTQLQNVTFLEDQKNITARCAEGLKNVTASALARIGIKTNFNKEESKNLGAKFRFLLNNEDSSQNDKDITCTYDVIKVGQSQESAVTTEGILTTHIVYPARLTVPEPKPESSPQEPEATKSQTSNEQPKQDSEETPKNNQESASSSSAEQPKKNNQQTPSKENLSLQDISKVLNYAIATTLSIQDFVAITNSDPSLQEIDLSRSLFNMWYKKPIGDEGAIALAEGLKINTALTTVWLNNNQIGDEGAKALAEGLKANKALTYVNLSFNQIGDEGAKALAEGLKANTALKEVSLSFNQIGDEGANALAEGLKANTALKEISLSFNQIGDAGKKALEDIKRSRPSLQIYY